MRIKIRIKIRFLILYRYIRFKYLFINIKNITIYYKKIYKILILMGIDFTKGNTELKFIILIIYFSSKISYFKDIS